VQAILAEILENLAEHGRLSTATERERGDPVISRARGILAKALQRAKGMKAKQAATLASAMFRGEQDPEDFGLPRDVLDKVRERAKQEIERERALLDDLLG